MLAVLAPGRTHPVEIFPVVRRVLEEHGHDVHEIHWDAGWLDEDPAEHLTADRGEHADAQEWVREQVQAAVAEAGEPGLLVGKSLGTRAAGLAAERGWPAIWLTPLLTDDDCVAQLQQARAPRLLVGGTADPFWDVETASALASDGAQVAQHEHADHALRVDGTLVDLAPDLAAFLARL